MRMAAPRRSRAVAAAVAGALIGAAGGAGAGAGLPGMRVRTGALAGALVVGAGEAITDLRRRPGDLKPLPWRITTTAAMAAAAGGLSGRMAPGLPGPAVGAVAGGLLGALGLSASRVALGVAVGAGVGVATGRWAGPGVVAGLAAAGYRVASATLLRRAPRLTVVGERVPTAAVRQVVPVSALERRVGADWVRDLASRTGGTFARGPADIGIVASLDALAGPAFDPSSVHPVVREFYEHTSRFTLAITPEWRWWMRPPYLLYRAALARPLGQADLPFDQRDAQRGVRSVIDTIADEDGEVVVRGWIRTFADTGEPIYVGVYTTYRDGDTGLVSVGFPLPRANFTATLAPAGLPGGGLLLSSRSRLAATGHYLSAVEDGELTTLRLGPLEEEIAVRPEGDALRAEHSFLLGRVRFLTLHYAITRVLSGIPGSSEGGPSTPA